jgi:RNA recognition motif-containing protein
MSLIKCRKCGGPHVTLKCGKEKQDLTTILENKFPQNNINFSHTSHTSNNYNHYHDRSARIDKRKIVTVRLSNLPEDITVNELTELINEWGTIGRINLTTYDNKSAFVDFYYKNEAEYFVKAIDKTPFDCLIISALLLEKD